MQSIWQITTKAPKFAPLKEDIDIDVAIVGGGIAGILCASLLNQRGFNTAIFEANTLCSGQIAGTTAKLTIQHGPIYAKMTEDYGFVNTRLYLEAQTKALDLYRQMIEENNISCHFKQVKSCLFTREHPEVLEREYAVYKQLGLDGELTDQTELPLAVSKALYLNNQALFHPLEFLYALVPGLTVYEHTRIHEVDGTTLRTSDGYAVKARKVIFACHYPIVNFPGYYFLKMYQSRSHVACFQCDSPIQNAYLSIDQEALSFRPFEKNILIGGFKHRTGEATETAPFDRLEHIAAMFENRPLTKVCQWASQDCMTLDGLPYVGQYAAKRPDWYVLTGFNKWGMTNAMAGAMTLCDQMIYQESEYQKIFAPDRFEPAIMCQPFFQQAAASMKGFTRYLSLSQLKIEDLKPDEGGIIQTGLKKTGVYKDKAGSYHYCSLVCPHLGCELQWNPVEKTWDCPCHGSRFDVDGQLLANPATAHLKKASDL